MAALRLSVVASKFTKFWAFRTPLLAPGSARGLDTARWTIQVAPISTTGCLRAEEEAAPAADPDPETTARDASKDRTKVIPVETSMTYLKSKAYKETYGDDPVWTLYRRNHKGAFPPIKTRKTCVRGGMISTGSPCPICRDEYLVLDHTNVDLLKQFISPHDGQVLSYSKTGLCQMKHRQLLVAIDKARDSGKLSFDVPPRTYDYSEYYKLGE